MAVDAFRMFELAAQGFCCSQILLILGLDDLGKTNPDLVRAMQGLCGGLGRGGKICGALTGGVCLLGLFAGRGTATEPPSDGLNAMVHDLTVWFEEEHNTLECADIVDVSLDSGNEYPVKCGAIVSATFEKVMEILAEHQAGVQGNEQDFEDE